MIFDTNILVYISKNILKIENLIDIESSLLIAVISNIEALGFSFATNEDQLYIQQICSSCVLIQLMNSVALETKNLIRKYKIKLTDADINAAALVENVLMLRNNTKYFSALDGKVKLINTFDL